MWVILVLLMLLLSLLLGSVALSSLLALLLFLVLLLLLVQAFWFGFEVGIPLNFFPLVWGNPSSSVSPRTSPLCHLFWAGPDSGPEPRLSYCWWWWLLKLLLLLLPLLLHSLVSRGRTSRCGQFVCRTNTSVSAPPPSLSSVRPHWLESRGWLWSHPSSGTSGRHNPRRLSRPGIWGVYTPPLGRRSLNRPQKPPQ